MTRHTLKFLYCTFFYFDLLLLLPLTRLPSPLLFRLIPSLRFVWGFSYSCFPPHFKFVWRLTMRQHKLYICYAEWHCTWKVYRMYRTHACEFIHVAWRLTSIIICKWGVQNAKIIAQISSLLRSINLKLFEMKAPEVFWEWESERGGGQERI